MLIINQSSLQKEGIYYDNPTKLRYTINFGIFCQLTKNTHKRIKNSYNYTQWFSVNRVNIFVRPVY